MQKNRNLYQSMTPLTEAQIEWQGNTPFSLQYGDIYFSDQDGIEETKYVFLQQNQLPERWLNKDKFTILETGFGTGLNFYCTLAEWFNTADPDAQLYYVSVEKHPVSAAHLKKLALLWPQFAHFIEALSEVYPPAVSGYHQRTLFQGRVKLLLLWGDACEQLSGLSLQADACFLDGFAPAKNSEMWSADLFRQLARLLKPSATISTFTAVGDVRRGLNEAGFVMQKSTAFGNKRHMLTGQRDNTVCATIHKPWFQYPEFKWREKKAAVIGAGIAGITTAIALAESGWQVQIFEQAGSVAAGASGNLAGVVMPRLDQQTSDDSCFYWLAFFNAISRLNQLQSEDIDWHSCGVLQLSDAPESLLRNWPNVLSSVLTPQQASVEAGISLQQSALLIRQAGYLSPEKLCQTLLSYYQDKISICLNSKIDRLQICESGWQLHSSDTTFYSDVVVLCNAASASMFEQSKFLPLQPVRGQVSYLPAQGALSELQTVVCEQSYIIPAVDNRVVIGASFDRNNTDSTLSSRDHEFNFKQYRECLRLADTSSEVSLPSEGRAAIRAVTPDRMPIVGAVPIQNEYQSCYADIARGYAISNYPSARYHQGLFLNTGHGSRGLTSSFLCAEYLSSLINNSASPLPSAIAERLHPGRFLIRELYKTKI